MIDTFFGNDQLVTSPDGRTFFVALLLGWAFGFALERAGFGSSKRLAGIFYLRDMTVLKVMFTAMVTAMLGISIFVGMDWIDLPSQVSLMETYYGAQIFGGLIFGIGFAMSGWCPGTAAVGLASGKIDALVFLAGTVIGAILYSETFPLIQPLRIWGETGEPLQAFGFPITLVALLVTIAAIGAFYFSEWIEQKISGTGILLKSSFLRAFSVVLLSLALAAAFVLPISHEAGSTNPAISQTTSELLISIEEAKDHFEPEKLADRLMDGDQELLLIDIRSQEEYEAFHIRGAINVPLSEVESYLSDKNEFGIIVLYSNGMTHPAQARDALAREGYDNVYILTGGLDGFVDWCLKPVSLREEPLPEQQAERVRAWRRFFL